MVFKKLKRTHSHGYANYIPNFKEVFPELRGIDSEELANRFEQLGVGFYCEERTPVPPAIRATLPLALLVWILMFIGLPINFWITGRWGYSLGRRNRLLNWFRMLGLERS